MIEMFFLKQSVHDVTKRICRLLLNVTALGLFSRIDIILNGMQFHNNSTFWFLFSEIMKNPLVYITITGFSKRAEHTKKYRVHLFFNEWNNNSSKLLRFIKQSVFHGLLHGHMTSSQFLRNVARHEKEKARKIDLRPNEKIFDPKSFFPQEEPQQLKM